MAAKVTEAELSQTSRDVSPSSLVVTGSARRRLGKADQDIQAEVLLAQVLNVLAFHDFDAPVPGRESVPVLGHPGRCDEYALSSVLIFHDAGQGADGLDADGAAVALGLDDAHATEH